jgi:DNA-binding FadR family transcriptional regulator
VIRIGNGKCATVSPLDDSILRTFFHRAITFQGHMFQELMELRRGLEIQSAMLAAERRTLDNIREMERTVRAMRESLQNPIPYADLDVSFHLHIAAATRNSLLLSLIDSIRASLRESILYGLQHRATLPDLERVQACHETILDEIRAQDAQAAAQAMTRHFDEALTAVLKGPGETPPNSPDEPRR